MEPFEFPKYFCFCRSYAGCKIKIAEIFYVFYTAPIYMVNRYLYLYIGTYVGALEPWRYWTLTGGAGGPNATPSSAHLPNHTRKTTVGVYW